MDDFKSSDIVKGYLEKFPDIPTRTLSRIIYNDNKECFTDTEHVRSTIRHYRGAGGISKLNSLKDRRYIREYSKDLMNPFKLPESDEREFEPFLLRPEDNRILVLSDIHLPYHNIEAVTTAIQYGLDNGVNTVLLNGDIIDFHQLSQFVKDPRNRHFKEEKEIAIRFLSVLRETFKDSEIYMKSGNHSERLETYLKVKAPELYGEKAFELNELLCFDDFDITYIKDKRTIKAGKLNILHGHELKGGLIPPVNPARGVFLRTGVQTLVGHFHRTSQHTDPNLDNDLISCWSTGCLCHDDKTEILTNNGFKFFEDLKNEDSIAEFNQHNSILTYRKPLKYQKFLYDGDMINFKSQRLDQMVTPEHKMLVTRGENDIKTMSAIDVFNRKKNLSLFNSGIYDGDWIYFKDERDFLFAELIGFIITDGHYRIDSNGIRLYQKVKYDRVKFLLEKLEITYNVKQYSNRVPVFNINAFWGKIIRDINPVKNRISKFLLNSKQECLIRLYEGLILGDGTRRKNNVTDTFYSHEIQLCYDFQELCCKTNKSCIITKREGVGTNLTKKEWYMHVCQVRKSKITKIQEKSIHKYNGFVYDITTTDGFFVVRRNDKISISGNCEINPEWMPNNKWNHGAAIVYVEESGDFNVDNFMINKSKVFRA